MKSKKNILVAAFLAMLCIGINSANANNLTQMDVKKSSTPDTVDVTFYTTDLNTNTVVTKKSNNRYVVLMPNVSSNSSVTPNFGGLKDIISDINVKHVDDGIGGYTKVTFETTKPINIKTHNVKSAPLTQAQKDAKTIIAQNNTTPAAKTETTQPKTAATPKTTPVDTSKVATTQTPKSTVSNVPKTNITKPAETKTVKQTTTPKTEVKTEQPKTVQKTQPKVEPKKTEQPKVKTAKNDFVDSNYDPKMKFDNNGKRKVVLEPRVSHPIQTTAPKSSKTEVSPDNVIDTDNVVMPDEVPVTDVPAEENKSNMPLAIFGGLGLLGLVVLFLVFDALSHKSQKSAARQNSFFNMAAQNQAKRRRKEYYDIVNNKDLSWQEKYKLYNEKEQEYSPKRENSDASFVTDLSGTKKAIIMPQEQKTAPVKLTQVIKRSEKSHNDIVREKLQAKISQMEHSLSQTPSANEPVETPKGVQSEDNSIINAMKNIKLKSFSKPVSLRETNRALVDASISHNAAYKEGQFVKLKNSPLSVNKRHSVSSVLNSKDLINAGNKYLTNNEDLKMKKENENYLLSSLDEYLSILDAEESKSSSIVDTLSKVSP